MLHLAAAVLALAADPQITIVKTDDAVPRAIAAHKGSVVIVKFWATWCDPCVAEFPHFLEVAKAFPQAQVVSVSVDLRQGIESSVKPFLKKHNVAFPTLLLDVDDPAVVMAKIDKAWDGTLPATFVYGKDGKLAKSFVGPAKELKETVAKLLQ
jgi:thiol-disulfide isomerase/thioredoxin